MTITESFVDWGLALMLADIPDTVQRAAIRHLIDGFGCAVAASRLHTVPFVTEVASQFTGPAEATIIGTGQRVPAPMAALGNGTLIHGLDFDDTHAVALVHATAAVLPAAFAVGEAQGSRGADVLTACIVGYELVTRLGAAVRHGFHRRGFHATSVCGVFAAALVSARLMGLKPATAVDALGIAGSQAAGSLEFLTTGASTKQFHPGWSGLSGIFAARVAAAGGSGPATILEGGNGLYQAYAGQTVTPGSILDGLGTRWETTAITIKPYPACQLSHASFDALSSLRAQLSDPNGIESITFTVPTDSVPIICEPQAVKFEPRTSYEAKFSLAWSAAALLCDGRLSLGTYTPDRLRAPEIVDLARRVHYSPADPGVPAADAPGQVEVRLRDGRTLSGQVPKSRGGPDLPLTDGEVLGKFLANCGEHRQAEQIAERLLGLAQLDELSPLLQGTANLSASGAAA